MEYGLIALVPENDADRRRIVAAYHAVTQPITSKKPPGPSLIRLAYLVGEEWNVYFDR